MPYRPGFGGAGSAMLGTQPDAGSRPPCRRQQLILEQPTEQPKGVGGLGRRVDPKIKNFVVLRFSVPNAGDLGPLDSKHVAADLRFHLLAHCAPEVDHKAIKPRVDDVNFRLQISV